MSEDKPRPPRIRPSRTGRAVPEVEPGRCYVCGAPATETCRQCRRPVCGEHLVPLPDELQAAFGPDACPACVEYTAQDLARDEGQWAQKRRLDVRHRTCHVCGREFEQALPTCAQCGRHLCSDHRFHYRKRFRFGAQGEREEAWYWDHEVRCSEHKMNPLLTWLKGWRRTPSAK